MSELKSLEKELEVDIKMEELMQLTATLLEELIEEDNHSCHSIFNSAKEPSIDILSLLHRVQKITRFSRECLIIAIIFIDRYNLKVNEFTLSPLNVHKLLLTAIIIAAKLQDDDHYGLEAFEYAGGVSATQLLKFQIELLDGLQYCLFVSEEEYFQLEEVLYNTYADQEQQHTQDDDDMG